MADINARGRKPPADGDSRPVATPAAAPRAAQAVPDSDRDGRLVEVVELLFFAYRDFISEPDAMLAELGFGRAHHRVLHFVNRHPGLRVADLLEILKITKQSLARVLRELIEQGYIEQVPGRHDRRERLLHVTALGAALAERLLRTQMLRVGRAIETAGSGGRAVEAFLFAMITDADRAKVAELLAGAVSGAAGEGE